MTFRIGPDTVVFATLAVSLLLVYVGFYVLATPSSDLLALGGGGIVAALLEKLRQAGQTN